MSQLKLPEYFQQSSMTVQVALKGNFPPLGHAFYSRKEATSFKDVVIRCRGNPTRDIKPVKSGKHVVNYSCPACSGFMRLSELVVLQGSPCVCTETFCLTSTPPHLMSFVSLREAKTAVVRYYIRQGTAIVAFRNLHPKEGNQSPSNMDPRVTKKPKLLGQKFTFFLRLAAGTWFEIVIRQHSATKLFKVVNLPDVANTITNGFPPDAPTCLIYHPMPVPQEEVAVTTLNKGNEVAATTLNKGHVDNRPDCMTCGATNKAILRWCCECDGNMAMFCAGCLKHKLLKREGTLSMEDYAMVETNHNGDSFKCDYCRTIVFFYQFIASGNNQSSPQPCIPVIRPFGWNYERPMITKRAFEVSRQLFKEEVEPIHNARCALQARLVVAEKQFANTAKVLIDLDVAEGIAERDMVGLTQSLKEEGQSNVKKQIDELNKQVANCQRKRGPYLSKKSREELVVETLKQKLKHTLVPSWAEDWRLQEKLPLTSCTTVSQPGRLGGSQQQGGPIPGTGRVALLAFMDEDSEYLQSDNEEEDSSDDDWVGED